MFQVAKQYTPTFSIPTPSQIYPNWDVWFENIASGNPGSDPQILSGHCINGIKNFLCVIKLFDFFKIILRAHVKAGHMRCKRKISGTKAQQNCFFFKYYWANAFISLYKSHKQCILS
jgi:hypothetical protein